MTGRQITVAELSDAYHVGQIDARNRRARRIDLADTTPLAIAYHHGYDSRSPDPCSDTPGSDPAVLAAQLRTDAWQNIDGHLEQETGR